MATSAPLQFPEGGSEVLRRSGETRAARRERRPSRSPSEDLDPAASLEAVALRAAERMHTLCAADQALVEIIDGDGALQWGHVGALSVRRSRHPAAVAGELWRIALGGTPEICADTETDPRVDGEACRRVAARSLVTIPLRHLGAELGAMTAMSRRPRAFDGDQVEALQLVADQVTAVAVAARVIAELRRLATERESALAASEARYRRIFLESPLPMWVLDAQTQRFLAVNHAAVARYGYSAEEFAALSITALRQDGAHLPIDIHGARAGRATYTARHRLRDGRQIDVEVTAVGQEFDGRPAVLSIVNDVTERNRLEDQLREGAFRDPLTGGANRALLTERIAHAVSRMRGHRTGVAVLVLRIDHFKSVHDSLGHAAGNSLLQAAATLIQSVLGPGDTVGRLGGDEFAVLLEEVDGAGGALLVAERLGDAFRSPLAFAGRSLVTSLSIGTATATRADAAPDDVLRDAELALHAAEAGGTGRVEAFAPVMHVLAEERLRLEQDLRQAIDRGELRVHYQPVVSVQSGAVVGCEALVRWQRPRRRLVPPDAFIPLAEEIGLIGAIDTWVLDHACAQIAEWRAAGLANLLLAVNVSGRDLGRGDLIDCVSAALLESGLPHACLEVEITESSAVAQPAEALNELRRLRAAGISVAIDDFGTGYSSLSKLATFPVDRLKIDRSFVRDITGAQDDVPLVAGMIALAHQLGLAVTAEGVETAEQMAFLRRNGCDLVQGYLVSAPLPPDRFAAFLREPAQLVQSLSS